MGEQNGAAAREPGMWMLMHWQDEPQPERVLYLHDEADDGGESPPGAVVYQPATQNLRTVNPSRLKPLPAVQPVAYMVERAAGDRVLIWPGDFRAVHAAGAPSPGTVYTPLVPLAAPQAGAAPRDALGLAAELKAEADVLFADYPNATPRELTFRDATIRVLRNVSASLGEVGGAAPVDAREREELIQQIADAAIDRCPGCKWEALEGEGDLDLGTGQHAAARTGIPAQPCRAVALRRHAAALRGALPDTHRLLAALMERAFGEDWRDRLSRAHAYGYVEVRRNVFPTMSIALADEVAAALSGTPEQPASDVPEYVPRCVICGQPRLLNAGDACTWCVPDSPAVTDPETLDITAPPAQGGENATS